MSLGQGSNEASEKEREKLHDNDDGLKGESAFVQLLKL